MNSTRVLLAVAVALGGWSAVVSAQPTPGSAASFRAVGNEPGWTLDIGGRRMQLVADYGATRAEVPTARRSAHRGRTPVRGAHRGAHARRHDSRPRLRRHHDRHAEAGDGRGVVRRTCPEGVRRRSDVAPAWRHLARRVAEWPAPHRALEDHHGVRGQRADHRQRVVQRLQRRLPAHGRRPHGDHADCGDAHVRAAVHGAGGGLSRGPAGREPLRARRRWCADVADRSTAARSWPGRRCPSSCSPPSPPSLAERPRHEDNRARGPSSRLRGATRAPAAPRRARLLLRRHDRPAAAGALREPPGRHQGRPRGARLRRGTRLRVVRRHPADDLRRRRAVRADARRRTARSRVRRLRPDQPPARRAARGGAPARRGSP